MKNMQSIKKRALAFLLSLAMCMSLLSTAVFAVEAGGTTGAEDSPVASDTQTSDETTNETGAEGGTTPAEGNIGDIGGEAVSTEGEDDAKEEEAPVYICGKEEHTHGEDCYELRPVYELICGSEDENHEHTPECYGEPVLKCKFEGFENGESHVHTEECEGEAELVCELEEGDRHIHTGECLGESVLSCELEESESHTHDEECYTETEKSVHELTCGQEEGEAHIHSEECYTETIETVSELTCGQEDYEGHTHDENCYTTGLTCKLEETEGHIHGEECYQPALICGTDETHEHTAECYKTEKVSICEVEEHVHTVECCAVYDELFNGLQALSDKFPAFQMEYFDNLTEDVEDPLAGFAAKASAQFGEEFNALLELYKQLPTELADSEGYLTLKTALETFASAMGGDLNSGIARMDTIYPIKYTENNINFELYENGTAKVISGEKNQYYRIIVPGTVTYEDRTYRVTVIGEQAFYNKGYAQVTLSEGLETIEKNAFGYTYLYGKDLVIPNSVITIEERAFAGFNRYATEASHINKIILGDNLETIGYCAFYFNAGITDNNVIAPFPVEVECGTNLKSVDPWAFYYSYSYNDVKSVTVRGFEGAIDDVLNAVYAFSACGLTYTMIDSNNILSVQSLQKAINESNGPTRLTLKNAHYIIKDSVVIPNGKDITITNGNSTIVFEPEDYMFKKPMFKIEKGGKLTIDAATTESLIINAAPLAVPGRLTATTFQINGELVLKDGLINGGGGIGMNMGMFSGAIVLGDNAKFDMSGGVIQGTSTDGAHSAPIVVGSGAVFNMSGGKITDNINRTSIYNGYAAGAVLIYGWSSSDIGGKMNLTGNAEISNNSTRGVGGAITLVGNAELQMDGGTITGNRSTGGTSSNGGGVCVAGRTGGMSTAYDAKCVFTMDGGVISDNEAEYGGGIYVNSNHVTLNAGEITGNKARMTGGGVYVETPNPKPNSLKMYNALITGNTASVMGGGMYFCPTGTAELYIDQGAGIFDNTSDGAADDFVSVVVDMSSSSKSATLSERMLGGGRVNWYRDGSVAETSLSGGWGFVTEDSVRYDAENPGDPLPAGSYKYSLALKAAVSDGVKHLAEESAQLIITGNHATRGGGVGANGWVTAGYPSEDEEFYSLKITKAWENIPEEDWKPVEIQVMSGEHVLETVKLSQNNNWTYTLTGLSKSVVDTLEVKELTEGYEVSYSETTLDGLVYSVTVTNGPLGSLSVEKKWDDGEDKNRPESAAVQLYRTGKEEGAKKEAFGEPVILNKSNDWSHTWDNLEKKYTWTVEEIDVPDGYTPKYQLSEDGKTITITNIAITNLEVHKIWIDSEMGKRPESVKVQLYRAGKETDAEKQPSGEPVILNDANGWSYIWDNLEKKYTWTVEEIDVPEGYISSIEYGENGTIATITNTAITTLTVNKEWIHNGNNNHPASVTVQLYKDGKAEGDAVILSGATNWTYTWEELDSRFKWTTGEINVPEGYTSVTTTNEDGTVVTITNTYRRPVTPPPEQPDPTPDPEPTPDPDPDPDPDPEDPTYEVPDEPTPLTEIPDTPPPLSELPQEDLLDIFDEDVPLAGGIGSGNNDAVWYLLALFSLAGLGLLNLLEKKLFRK